MAKMEKRKVDWDPIRQAFVDRRERPSWAELSDEFSIPEATILACARDESWALLRTRRTAALLERSGAHEMILASVSMQKAVTDKFSNITLRTVEALENCLQELDTLEPDGTRKLAASTRAGILNTISFAVGNLARALKESGVVGLPKALMDQLNENAPKGPEGKDYLARALQQINITVTQAREGKGETVSIDRIPTAKDRRTMEVELPSKRSNESEQVARLVRKAERVSLAKWAEVL